MIRLIQFFLILVTTSARSRLSLQVENSALRHQLSVYRKSGQRPRIRPADRLLWSVMSRLWSGWRAALFFVQPRTVTTWQKKRFRDHWRALSQPSTAFIMSIFRRLHEYSYRWASDPDSSNPGQLSCQYPIYQCRAATAPGTLIRSKSNSVM